MWGRGIARHRPHLYSHLDVAAWKKRLWPGASPAWERTHLACFRLAVLEPIQIRWPSPVDWAPPCGTLPGFAALLSQGGRLAYSVAQRASGGVAAALQIFEPRCV